MKEVVLPSGAKLEITLAPFAESYELFMAVSEELKSIKAEASQEIDINFIKNIALTGISSKKVLSAIKTCMKRATYNGLKMDDNTFEDEKARQDYLLVLYEVAMENISPFTKGLYAKYQDIFQKVKSDILS